jgi:predicted AAA+ superfamily ATPase
VPKTEFIRPFVAQIEAALESRPALVQVLVGARQTGKTTAADQIAARWNGPVIQASADLPLPPGHEWIEMHWDRARREVPKPRRAAALLVLDEVQKVGGWSEVVKARWDEDRRTGHPVRPLLLGSSALLVQKGMVESLAGRFFLHRCPHWSFVECEEAFGWDLDRWIFFGGYPGAALLADDEDAWRRYVSDSLVETAIARDVLSLQQVGKPLLLRHLFGLVSQHPAEILSFNKMLGTLQDAGNTVTLAHYLRLLEASFLVSGLDRLAGRVRQRGSSPKIVLWNNALVTALSSVSFAEARREPSYWGRLVENAAGAHFLNGLWPPRYTVGYWRDRNDEVDFVVVAGRTRTAIEVKSGRPSRPVGLAAHRRRFPSSRAVTIGAGGIPLEEFFRSDPESLVAL